MDRPESEESWKKDSKLGEDGKSCTTNHRARSTYQWFPQKK